MKKHFLIFLLGLNLLFVPAKVALAQTDLSQDIAAKSGYGQVDSSTLSETVGKIIRIVLGLLGTVFLCLTVYAGFLWMTAAGNSEQVEKALGILKTAVIGLVIILASYSITYFVLDSIFKVTT
ncbi:MAG: hypothetical protein KBC69_02315 [Candidatus Magasanikbacteria bacterium]|nr:hypothetical protein [Candidatus Magasanikbacteria bacterium]